MHGYAAIREAAMSGMRKELAAGVNINDDRVRGEADMHGHVGLTIPERSWSAPTR